MVLGLSTLREVVGTEVNCCGSDLVLQVLYCNSGYYLGYTCVECGPKGKVSGYFDSDREASKALLSGLYW